MLRIKYKDAGGNSGVDYYRIGRHYIAVWFKENPDPYYYYEDAIGKDQLSAMKKLASSGLGLSAYINQHAGVKNNAEPKRDLD